MYDVIQESNSKIITIKNIKMYIYIYFKKMLVFFEIINGS